MRSKVVMGAAAVVAAAALVGGSVATTGALWNDQEQIRGASVTTGFLDLTPGTRSGSAFTFTALAQSPVALNQVVSATLVIRNSGKAPLRFRLDQAGPSVSTSGATVQVQLGGDVIANGTACGEPILRQAFAAAPASTPSGPVAVKPWHSLAVNATETWCVRTALTSVTGTQPATYTHLFKFGVEST